MARVMVVVARPAGSPIGRQTSCRWRGCLSPIVGISRGAYLAPLAGTLRNDGGDDGGDYGGVRGNEGVVMMMVIMVVLLVSVMLAMKLRDHGDEGGGGGDAP